ncbi:MAG: DNA-processing protein DprA [Gammaproteobacteria bacterium]|jgi:DNA processing protein
MATPLQLQYLQLFHFDGFPYNTYARLIGQLGSMAALRDADTEIFLQSGIEESWREVILGCLDSAPASVNKHVCPTLSWLDRDAQHALVCYEDPAYPALLKELDCPPPLLFVIGDTTQLGTPQIAIIGSRKASRNGSQIAHWLARELAGLGLTITSGLAAGIDSQAHQGALAAGGHTLALMGTGVDRIYPGHNQALARRISRCGALISEFPLGTPPMAGNFPQRNRLIAGLSLGVVVVEAAPKSGSLITARLAMEANREVFAVPGSIFNGNARGCHGLIRDGAKLVDSVESIVEELMLSGVSREQGAASPASVAASRVGNSGQKSPSCFGSSSGASAAKLCPEETRILLSLGHDPCPADLLAERCGFPIEKVNRLLLSLELKGLLVQGGGRYQCTDTSLPPLSGRPAGFNSSEADNTGKQ